jgi:hypothetical protein
VTSIDDVVRALRPNDMNGGLELQEGHLDEDQRLSWQYQVIIIVFIQGRWVVHPMLLDAQSGGHVVVL